MIAQARILSNNVIIDIYLLLKKCLELDEKRVKIKKKLCIKFR